MTANKDIIIFFVLVAILILLSIVFGTLAFADQRTTYDVRTGKATTRETIDTQGTRTTYDAKTGAAITRESKPREQKR